jgi:protein arginine kinase activator
MNGKNDMSLNLCESCAVKNGFQIGQENSIHIPALLEKLKSYKKGLSQEDMNVVCHNCNTTLAEVKRHGTVGCSQCYEYFDEYLSTYFRSPGENRQKGGRARGPVREVISQAEYRKALEKKLEQAVSIEDYESAAVLRDKIKALVE